MSKQGRIILLPPSKNKWCILAASLILRWSVLSPSKAGVSTTKLTCAVEIQHLFLNRGSIFIKKLNNMRLIFHNCARRYLVSDF